MLRGVVTTIFGIFWAIVLGLTGGRFLALLANANRNSELVSWLYRHRLAARAWEARWGRSPNTTLRLPSA
jgi:hypothetical protein